ncbi:MAG: MbcA/ParS/Xre antitoxin family protein [Bacteroidia bacterium]
MNLTEKEILAEIPAKIDTNKTLQLIRSGHNTKKFIGMLKSLTKEGDQEISQWLSISVKTLRSYKNTPKITKSALVENMVMLISLFKHGQDVFGSQLNFKEWLGKKNFYFDGKPPIEFMDSVSGIKFIDDSLTAMEYGDNG